VKIQETVLSLIIGYRWTERHLVHIGILVLIPKECLKMGKKITRYEDESEDKGDELEFFL
jgi:hypothetical protein